jgi:hypothetical protein
VVALGQFHCFVGGATGVAGPSRGVGRRTASPVHSGPFSQKLGAGGSVSAENCSRVGGVISGFCVPNDPSVWRWIGGPIFS